MIEISKNILNIVNPEEEKFLRKKIRPFDFKKFTKKDIAGLIKKMREMMERANGDGLAASQVGLDQAMFIAKHANKFYAIFNPKIVKSEGGEVSWNGEGCLSIPGKYGKTYRSDKVMLQGFDRNGKAVKIKAWGGLALVFQHEVDHLNGILWIDRTKKQ